MDDRYLQQNVAKMEKELKDLKTIQGAIKKASGFTGTYTHHDSTQQGQLNQIVEITYGDDNANTLSYVSGNRFAVMLQPNGNKQRVFFVMLNNNSTIVVQSNRPITSITRIT